MFMMTMLQNTSTLSVAFRFQAKHLGNALICMNIADSFLIYDCLYLYMVQYNDINCLFFQSGFHTCLHVNGFVLCYVTLSLPCV